MVADPAAEIRRPASAAADKVEKWIQRFKALCILEEYEEKLQVRALITFLGDAGYELLANATAPTLPEEKKLDELLTILRTQTIKTKSIVVAR